MMSVFEGGRLRDPLYSERERERERGKECVRADDINRGDINRSRKINTPSDNDDDDDDDSVNGQKINNQFATRYWAKEV